MVPRIRVVHPRLQALRGASSWMEVHSNICTRHAVLCTHRGNSHRGSAQMFKTISGMHKHTEAHPSISEKWIVFAVVDWCWLPPFLASIECTSQSTSHKQTLSICFELVAMGMGLPTLFLHVFFLQDPEDELENRLLVSLRAVGRPLAALGLAASLGFDGWPTDPMTSRQLALYIEKPCALGSNDLACQCFGKEQESLLKLRRRCLKPVWWILRHPARYKAVSTVLLIVS